MLPYSAELETPQKNITNLQDLSLTQKHSSTSTDAPNSAGQCLDRNLQPLVENSFVSSFRIFRKTKAVKRPLKSLWWNAFGFIFVKLKKILMLSAGKPPIQIRISKQCVPLLQERQNIAVSQELSQPDKSRLIQAEWNPQGRYITLTNKKILLFFYVFWFFSKLMLFDLWICDV